MPSAFAARRSFAQHVSTQVGYPALQTSITMRISPKATICPCLLFVLAAVFSACSRGVPLRLSNASAAAIHNVIMTYRGPQAIVGDLPKGS